MNTIKQSYLPLVRIRDSVEVNATSVCEVVESVLGLRSLLAWCVARGDGRQRVTGGVRVETLLTSLLVAKYEVNPVVEIIRDIL